MTLSQFDLNMIAAMDELDLLPQINVATIMAIAHKHNVDADDLFEAWSEA